MLTTHPFFNAFCKELEINEPSSLNDNLFFFCNKCSNDDFRALVYSANIELIDRYLSLIGDAGTQNLCEKDGIYHDVKKSFSLNCFDTKKMDNLMEDVAILLCETELIDSVCDIDW